MEIKLSSNDLYPLGCQCHEEAENMMSVCVCVCVDQNEPQSVADPSQWLASVLRSMAGEILPATPRRGQPCPFKIEHWLACCGSWRAGSSLELTRRETRSDSLGEGVSPPDQTALREGKRKDANDSLLGILPGNQRIWLKWSTHFSLLIKLRWYSHFCRIFYPEWIPIDYDTYHWHVNWRENVFFFFINNSPDKIKKSKGPQIKSLLLVCQWTSCQHICSI